MSKAANRYHENPSFSTPPLNLATVTRGQLVTEISATLALDGSHGVWEAVRFRHRSAGRSFNELVALARSIGVKFTDDQIQRRL